MDNKITYLTFASSLTNLCSVNSSFDSAILRIAYTGENVNRTSISKETFEKCLYTMYNCPIVCNYDRATDSIGGHDIELVHAKDGSVRLVNITTPVGCVPESANYYWEFVEEDDGIVHEYLCTEVLLWKRQEAYRKIKNDGITSHSMEIKIKDGYMVDSVFNITDFEFNAFCLLGDVKPCFESSALEFAKQNFSAQLSEMMQDLKELNFDVNTPDGDDNIHPQKILTEGGKKALDKKQELIAKYGIDVDTLDFSIEDLSIEELTERFEAMANEANEPTAEPEDTTNYSLTGATVEEIHRELGAVKYDTPWGEESRYWYIDCDFELSEVYAYDIADWLVYGFTYAQDGDSIAIDFDSKKRKKFAIVDFDEGEQENPVASVFARAEQAINDNAEWQSKYNEASTAIESMESELTELRQYKADIESAEAQSARDEVFSRFTDLEGIEAFASLKENCSDMDIETLEEKCFAIRGRNGVPAKFSANVKPPVLKVPKNDKDVAPYGGIVEEYSGKDF